MSAIFAGPFVKRLDYPHINIVLFQEILDLDSEPTLDLPQPICEVFFSDLRVNLAQAWTSL